MLYTREITELELISGFYIIIITILSIGVYQPDSSNS